MKLKPVALSLSQAEIDEIATELLEATQLDWQNAISLTLSQFPYTASEDGVLFMQPQITETGTASRKTVYVNGVAINEVVPSITISGTDYRRPSDLYIPLKKGDVVSFSSTQYLELRAATVFVPFKTMNPVSLRPLDPHKIDTAILNHWDDITSDFSTAGSSNMAIDNAKYNPALRKLRIKCHNTTSQASGSGRAFVITYNGSDLPVFTDSCIYTGSKIQTSWIKQANQVSFYIYNRTSSAWPANTYTNIQVEF